MIEDIHVPNINTPMRASWPDPATIVCRDCEFRDRTVIDFLGKKDPVGITRSYCQMYTPPSAGKPHEVLFSNSKCPYYMKEDVE